MKKAIHFLLVILVVLACKKDDDPEVSGSFTFDGVSYSLEKGFADYQGMFLAANYTYHIWAVTLTSANVSYSGTFSGTGDVVYLYFYTIFDDTTLPAATYLSDGLAGDNLIDLAEVYLLLDGDIGGKSGTSYRDFVSGEVIVTRSGGFHIIEFDLTDSQSRTLKGSLTAPLTLID